MLLSKFYCISQNYLLNVHFPSPSYSTVSSGFQQQNFECLQRIQKDGAARLMYGTPSFRFQYSIFVNIFKEKAGVFHAPLEIKSLPHVSLARLLR